MRKLLASTAIIVALSVGGCASSPPLPKLPTMAAPPPMPVTKLPTPPPPPPPPGGIVKYGKGDRVGATIEADAGADRVYPITIGVGNLTSTPGEAKFIQLPKGEVYNETLCDNPTLVDVKESFSGARNPEYFLMLKAMTPELAPFTADCRVMTSGGNYQIRARFVHGRSKDGVTTVRLKGQGAAGNPDNVISREALCQDNLFSWQRTVYWAPISVCATPDRTIINFDPRTQSMPVIHRFDGTGWSTVNTQTSGKGVTVMGVHAVLRATGEGGQYIDITRGGGY